MDEIVSFVQVEGNRCFTVGTLTPDQVDAAINWWQEHGDPRERTEICVNNEWYQMVTSYFGNESQVVVEPLQLPTYPMQRTNAVGPSTAVCEAPNQTKRYLEHKRAVRLAKRMAQQQQ